MTLWLTARGAGLAALVLLTLSTCLGVTTSLGGSSARRRIVTQYVHRAAGALGLGVLVLHVATIVADSLAGVGATGALVPFTSGYRATAVGLGTIAAYTMLLVGVLGAARGRLTSSATAVRTWRAVHGLAYPAWALAIVHGYLAGTDSELAWVRLLYLACLVAVAGAVCVRLVAPPARGVGGTRGTGGSGVGGTGVGGPGRRGADQRHETAPLPRIPAVTR